ncbi:phytoene/squalene synthase family protein [Sphingomonas qomolangmaensis]|uniref:Phytoene/squalene synthase family protein n=1 Tax=Sphingomonas qomolangmaensis TaxID=2918765 RepID=A0ABY5L898_9SPHN|nr:phytoene/squalene synthase family protein [Sphingomonas qomolangmaensis]UUL81975.1 phytoene/squalene synthase family protein [Sphingomonas qomolangmaensis]
MTHPLPARAAIVATAQQSIARGSKSFAAASRLFDRATRERAWLLYAWCRACDDLADGQDHGHGMQIVADPQARIAEIRAKTDAAFAGQWVGDPAFDALRIVAAETRMPKRFADDVVAGFQLDADDWRPRSEADLYRYCYHVAGVVGCMMAVVMGVDPADEATLDRACDLGLAFQLANIARDIEEDDRVGRCYLPVEWLVEMDIPPGQHMKPPFRQRLAVLSKRLADRAELHEASARVGTKALSFRSAWAVLAAAGIYGDIARRVGERGEHAWDHRVTTSGGEKLGWIVRSFSQARAREGYPDTPRDPLLWTRPR